MIKVATQARRWWDDIVAQRFPTIQALARAYGKDERYVARLTLQDLPVEWNEQSTLGFAASGSSR